MQLCGGVQRSFTAKSADTLRRNAVVMPLYSLTLAFILIAGFAAVLIVPGLPNGDLDRIVGEIAERRQDPYSVVEKIVGTAKFGRP